MKRNLFCFLMVFLFSLTKISGQQAASIVSFPPGSYYDSTVDKSSEKPLYLLTYDHGGVVLWDTAHFAKYLRNAVSWLDKYPGFKIGLENEAYTYDYLMENDTALLGELKGYLNKYKGRLGIGTCTYGQPLSQFINEESNIRQIQYALEANKNILGVVPSVYLMSEHAMHSQIPQILKGFNFTGAIMRTHFMMYGYNPTFNSPIGWWVGVDGSKVPTIPTYKGEGNGFGWVTEDNFILTRYPGPECNEPLEAFKKKFSGIYPLLASRADDSRHRFEGLVSEYEGKKGFQWMLLDELFPAYPTPVDEYKTLPNDFHVRMPWGYCGNEIWIQSRKAEIKILIAERLAALSSLLGGPNYENTLRNGWKNLLVAQHHDIQICGILKDSRKFLPASIGASDSIILSSLSFVASHMQGGALGQVTVFNPLSWERKEWATVWVKMSDKGIKDFTVSRGSQQVPFEVLEIEKNTDLSIDRAKIAFLIEIPAFSFQSFSVSNSKKKQNTSVLIKSDIPKLQFTTPYWEVTLNPEGGLLSIVDRKSGMQMIDEKKRNCYFEGVIDGKNCVSNGKWLLDSIFVTNECFTAVETGKIGGIPYRLKIKLDSYSPKIDFSVDFTFKSEMIGRLSDNKKEVISPFLHEEKLRFKVFPSIGIGTTGIRDLPFAIAETGDKYIEGNYWTSVADGHVGMAIFNGGNMGSVREEDNGFSLPLAYSMYYVWRTILLEGDYKYTFALYPFTGKWEDSDLHKKALEFGFPCVALFTNKKGDGAFGGEKRTFDIQSDNIIVSALYPSGGKTFIRMYESHGEEGQVQFQYLNGKGNSVETNLNGQEIGIASPVLHFRPWQFRTFKFGRE